jgi:hypothetical protein
MATVSTGPVSSAAAAAAATAGPAAAAHESASTQTTKTRADIDADKEVLKARERARKERESLQDYAKSKFDAKDLVRATADPLPSGHQSRGLVRLVSNLELLKDPFIESADMFTGSYVSLLVELKSMGGDAYTPEFPDLEVKRGSGYVRLQASYIDVKPFAPGPRGPVFEVYYLKSLSTQFYPIVIVDGQHFLVEPVRLLAASKK